MEILQKADCLNTILSAHGPLPPPEASGDAGRVLMKATARNQKVALIKDMILDQHCLTSHVQKGALVPDALEELPYNQDRSASAETSSRQCESAR